MTFIGIDVFTGRPLRVETEHGFVARVQEAGSGDNLPYLAPGFFDIQVNGYRGLDYSAEELAPEHVDRIIADLAAAGVTRHQPTLVTGPRDRVARNLAVIASAAASSPAVRAAIPGIHLEGPYISPLDGPRGAHNAAFTRDPAWDELVAWQEAAHGMIRLLTLAPERDGAIEMIERATHMGIRVAIGHTAAEPATIAEAVKAGASLSTHLGNGSHGMIPRLKNYIWEQLATDELLASIITDGFHLPEAVIRTFWRTKGPRRIILVSDATALAGREPGLYDWGGIRVQVFPDGHLGVAGTEYLAGAAHLLDWDIPHCVAAAGCGLGEAVAACTANPCGYLGLPPQCGRIEPGAPAHLVLFRWQPGEKRLRIEQTVRDGEIVCTA
jgi:N-acetylglucosamine-6-phosphate deacetylase